MSTKRSNGSVARCVLIPTARPRPPPRVRLFVMGSNTWRAFDGWPVPSETLVLYLADRRLKAGRPEDPGCISFVYDPTDPVPSTYSADYQDAPVDQRILDGRRDIVRFESHVLDAPLEVIGKGTVVLHAATDGPDTDWHVKLLDVAPDGTAINVATGMIRARWREGFDRPSLVEPGAVVRIRHPVARDGQPVRGRPPHPARRDEQRLPELRSQPQHGRRRCPIARASRRAPGALVRRGARIAPRAPGGGCRDDRLMQGGGDSDRLTGGLRVSSAFVPRGPVV